MDAQPDPTMSHPLALAPSAGSLLADDLIDMANRLQHRAGAIPDGTVSDRLRKLAGQIEEIGKEMSRRPS
jgi:hypothetical protein